jgi:hypothetical protein
MSDCLIEFHALQDVAPSPFPEPIPAAKSLPEWLKSMPSSMPRSSQAPDLPPEQPTIKKCPPLVDAMTDGYLIPLVADVIFSMESGRLRFKSDLPIVQTHAIDQLKGSPFDAGMVVVKFLNPWLVRTPPGYSCLFTQPLNRFDLPFQLISGVVETDTFYREVNFPALCMLRPGQQFLARKGTPLAQVLPFRRESWTSRCEATDMDRRNEVMVEVTRAGMGHYKTHNWVRKSYE